LYSTIALLSALMVSRLPLMALKFKNFKPADNMPKIILLLVALIAAVLLKWLAIPVVFIAYILVSLLFKNKTT
jgi:CDP-diacylglycerol---serine O-phosphatidyltransferase